MRIQVAEVERGDNQSLRWAQDVWPIPKVVGILSLRVVHTVKLPERAEKIGLTMPQIAVVFAWSTLATTSRPPTPNGLTELTPVMTARQGGGAGSSIQPK